MKSKGRMDENAVIISRFYFLHASILCTPAESKYRGEWYCCRWFIFLCVRWSIATVSHLITFFVRLFALVLSRPLVLWVFFLCRSLFSFWFCLFSSSKYPVVQSTTMSYVGDRWHQMQTFDGAQIRWHRVRTSHNTHLLAWMFCTWTGGILRYEHVCACVLVSAEVLPNDERSRM